MTKTPDDTTPTMDLDALLATPVPEPTPEPVAETATQRRIRELNEALAEPAPVIPTSPESFRKTESLSPEEQQIRDLEDRLARKKAQEAEAAGVVYDNDEGTGETILLHFLVDGFTLGAAVWYRGQEVEFRVGSKAYEQTKDRMGKTWLSLVDDPAAQYARWGQQMFAAGPWPGKKWDDFSHLSDPDEIAQAEKAADAERRRGRSAPVI